MFRKLDDDIDELAAYEPDPCEVFAHCPVCRKRQPIDDAGACFECGRIVDGSANKRTRSA